MQLKPIQSQQPILSAIRRGVVCHRAQPLLFGLVGVLALGACSDGACGSAPFAPDTSVDVDGLGVEDDGAASSSDDPGALPASDCVPKGIEVEGNAGETIRVARIDDGDWVGYSQVDFRAGATQLVARVASASGGGIIDVRIDGCDDFTEEAGTSIGTCNVESTGSAATFTEVACALTETSGAHDLCLRFSGNTAFELDSWHLE